MTDAQLAVAQNRAVDSRTQAQWRLLEAEGKAWRQPMSEENKKN